MTVRTIGSIADCTTGYLEGASAPLTTYAKNKGFLLTPGTYYVPFGEANSWIKGIGLYWGALFAGTFTVEDTIFQRPPTGDVTDYEASALARWVEENPPSTYIGVDATNISAAKVVWTAATGVVTAGAVGGSLIHLSLWGASRGRVKIACTAGDYVRVATIGKD